MSLTAFQAILKERSGCNQYYDEVVAEGILPLRMMLIPSGTFLMGSPDYELERSDTEGPQHEVTIFQFFMAKYPLTQTQWRVIAAMPRVNRDLNPNPSHFKGDLRPVENVSWEDAVEFCDRLAVHTNRQYRLPHEAEWEYACRAGTVTPFHFGKTITTKVANYRGTDDESLGVSGSYDGGPNGEYRQATTSIDYFRVANNFGLCDMHGNVWEWCADYWHKNYESTLTDDIPRVKGGDSSLRVLRGGSWGRNPRYCRSAYRRRYRFDSLNFDIGFRVVCSAPKSVL